MSGDYTCHADLTLCTNTDGSYQCACDVGYQGNGVECGDFNECFTDPCHAYATCANNVGSFVCTCNAGYASDGFNCVDDNDCDDGSNNCHADAACTNVPGSFQCACNDNENDPKKCVIS